jgi:hypothetical protein
MRNSSESFFGDLNHDILGPPGDGKIIIIDDSNDDDEVQEEGTADAEPMIVPASAADALLCLFSAFAMPFVICGSR